MGLDERDYMRDRYRQRQGLEPGATQWNDKKARRELAAAGHKKAVPLGSASWISATSTGSWFASKDRGHDYQRARWRPRRSRRSPLLTMALRAGLVVLLVAAGIGGRFWLAESMSAVLVDRFGQSFPASGSVIVPSSLDMRVVKSRLTAQGGRENSIVQLVDVTTMRPALSVYVRAFERVTVAAPTGQYRVRFIHGPRWGGPDRLFGSGTVQDEVIGVMPFTRSIGHVLDLRLGPDSGLAVQRLSSKPESLQ